MKKLIITIITSLLIISCATTPENRFPKFKAHSKNITSIDVVFDLVIASDIEGDLPGVDIERHKEMINKIGADIQQILQEKGYRINNFYADSGLFIGLENPDDLKSDMDKAPDENTRDQTDSPKSKTSGFVFAKDNKSTGETVTGPFLNPGTTPWSDKEVRTFLNSLMLKSSDYFSNTNNPDPYFEKIPEALANSSSETLMIVKILVGEVSTGKSVGTAMLTGILTAILSGGTYIAVSTQVDGHINEASIVNLDKKEIIWYNKIQHQGRPENHYAISTLFDPLVNPVTGETTNTKEKDDHTAWAETHL